ncbi:hypothetical protein EDB19DRAFT_1833823 [Suillus lakei]|nr:hypothetical protein EDB19DRAFT_1833823 [Suillus lakei]
MAVLLVYMSHHESLSVKVWYWFSWASLHYVTSREYWSAMHQTGLVQVNAGDIAGILKEIQEAQKTLINGWIELNARVMTLQGCIREKIMAKCFQQWQVRKILNYQEEEDLLASGENPYM